MKRYYFSGVVHPERAQLTIHNLDFKIVDPAGTPSLLLRFNICNNQITAVAKCLIENEIYTVRNLVKASIEQIVAIVGFVRGYGYDVEIVKACDEENEEYCVFGIEIPTIESRYGDLDVNEAFLSIGPLFDGTEGVFLRRCLMDLNMAIRHVDDTPFYCYRALESLKQYFAFKLDLDTDNDREHWGAMASVISGEEDEVQPIRALAFPARHGVPLAMSDEQRGDVFTRTWGVVERFINWRLQQNGSTFRLQPTAEKRGG